MVSETPALKETQSAVPKNGLSGQEPNEQGYEDIQVYIDRGLSFYKQGKLYEALLEFLQVLAVDPLDPLGHYLCGITLQAFDLEDMAVAEWAAASSLNVTDGGKWDSDWDWIKRKSYEFVESHRTSSVYHA
jgi:tetratricopeptide (TPR) repeat protein